MGGKEHSRHLQLLSPKSGFAASQASTVGSSLYLFTVGLLFFLQSLEPGRDEEMIELGALS